MFKCRLLSGECRKDSWGGFELTLGGAGLTVTTVTLYAAERDGYSEYPGELPRGLSWSDGYYGIIDRLGQPDARIGGNGVTMGCSTRLMTYGWCWRPRQRTTGRSSCGTRT